MNRWGLYSLSLLLLAAGAAPVAAQSSPLRMTVTRCLKENRGPATRTPDGAREEPLLDRVYYTIELANSTSTTLKDVAVKWAVLVQQRVTGIKTVVEGESRCALAFGERRRLDTDIIELSGVRTRNADGSVGESKSQILGYAVEVYVGGRLVAAEAFPADTPVRIKEVKGEQAEPGVHRF
jgi:hypothetical protein